MVEIGTVTGQEIRENRDGGVDVRLLQVQMIGDDVQTVQYMPMAGDDAPPMVGDLVAVVPIGPAFQVALGVRDSVVPSAAPGEKKIYSRDENGAIIARLHLKADGSVDLANDDVSVSLSASGGATISNASASIALGASGVVDISNATGAGQLKADGSWDLNGALIDILGNLTVPGNLLVAGSIGGGGVAMAGGAIEATGDIETTGDVIGANVTTAGGVDLGTHTHGGTEPGAGSTGAPN